MLKNVLSIVSSPGRRIASHNCDSISAQTLVRYLSTSSAIDKGLRKSRHGRSRFDPPARVGGITRRGEYAKGVEDRRQGKPSLDPRSIRRAGYGKQVDDSRPGTRTSTPWLRSRDDQEPATTPRQGRLPSRQGYLSSRQRPSFAATESKPLRSRPKPSTYDIGHSQKDSPRSLSPRWAQNQSGKPMARATPLNRAQRRAAAFGHMQNPPEGYKALPTISEEQQDRSSKRLNDDRTVSSRHSSSSWRVARGKGSPTTSSRVERRWADTPGRTDFRDASADRSALSSEDRPRRKSTAPLAIPYTTPASEFLYGHSVVTAALKSSRRRFYKLYLYNGDAAEVRGQDREVRKLALAANVEVTRVGNDWLKLMDKMSGGRPHNGYVLEASPLPRLPVTGLQPVPKPQPTFEVDLDHQSREEEAVNGNSSTIRYGTGYRRYPFLLLLDGIRDPGNMGAIFRSAHFLGADGIILSTRNTAALSPVTLKAAAGAAESLPIFSVDQPGRFIENCQDKGWKFYAAVSPSSSDSEVTTGRPFYTTSTMGIPTQEHPCVMILGSEGEGLRWNIQKKADSLLGIEAQRAGYGELDSLNVSVAAALLCHAFLKNPRSVSKVKRAVSEKSTDVLGSSGGREDVDLGTASDEANRPETGADSQRLF